MSANDPDRPDDGDSNESDEQTMGDVDHGGPGPNAPGLGDDPDVVDLGDEEFDVVESEPVETAEDVEDLDAAVGFGGDETDAPGAGDVSPGAVDGTGEVDPEAVREAEESTSTVAEDAATERAGTEPGAGGFVPPTAAAAERSDFEFGPHDDGEATDEDVAVAMAGLDGADAASRDGVSDEEAAAALLQATDEEVRASVVGTEVEMAQRNAANTLAAAMEAGYDPDDPMEAMPVLAEDRTPADAQAPVVADAQAPAAADDPETAVEAAAAPGVPDAGAGTAPAAGGAAAAATVGGATATAGGATATAAGPATATTAGPDGRSDAGPGWNGWFSDDPEGDERDVIDLEEGEDYEWLEEGDDFEWVDDEGAERTGDRDLDDLHDRLDAVGDRLDGVGDGLADVTAGMEDLTAQVEANATARSGAGGLGAGGAGGAGVGGLEGMLIQRGQMDLMQRQNEMENRLVRIEQKLDNLDQPSQSPQPRRPAPQQNFPTPTGAPQKVPKRYSNPDEGLKEFATVPGSKIKEKTKGPLGRLKDGITSHIPGVGGDDEPERDDADRSTGADGPFAAGDAPDVDAEAEGESVDDPFADIDDGDESVSTDGPGWDGAETGDRIVGDHLEDRVGEDTGEEANEADHVVDEDGETVDDGVPR